MRGGRHTENASNPEIMCCKTDKFKGFKRKSSQSTQNRKTSIAPYRHIGTEAQRGRIEVVKFTQRQHEVIGFTIMRDLGLVWNLSISGCIALERLLPF